MERIKLSKVVLQVVACLIFTVQMMFALEKYLSQPTMISTHTKRFSDLKTDLVLTICNKNQFNYDTASRFGYRRKSDFFMGSHTNNSMLTWRGIGGNITFHEMKDYLFQADLGYISDNNDSNWENIFVNATSVTNFLLPIGHCRAIVKLNEVLAHTNKIFVSMKSENYAVYVTDAAASVYFQLPSRSDKITMRASSGVKAYKSYSIKLQERNIETGDGQCYKYSSKSHYQSFGSCVDIEYHKRIVPVLGCMVPWMSDKDQCVEPIQREEKHEDLIKWIYSIYVNSYAGHQYASSSCLPPCSIVSAKIHYKDTVTTFNRENTLIFYFDEDVGVETVVLAYDFLSLLVEIGSSLGLWLGLSVVGVFDVLVIVVTKVKSGLMQLIWHLPITEVAPDNQLK